MIVQSATTTARGELVLTGMQVGEPPAGLAEALYLVMRHEPDGGLRVLWSDDQTWMVRPRASPDGARLALEGLMFQSDLLALELGGLCDAVPTH